MYVFSEFIENAFPANSKSLALYSNQKYSLKTQYSQLPPLKISRRIPPLETTFYFYLDFKTSPLVILRYNNFLFLGKTPAFNINE